MSEARQLDVNIMGRDFRVACPPEEEQALREAVAYVERKMREIRDGGHVIGLDKIAIMAALNIAHEFMHTRVTGGLDVADFRRRITAMQDTIDEALKEQQQLF
ncbi:cell division protein ZapA [Chitinimonas sp. BJYL2]|uniref:cell division protein ZapA n=1 Tax=Chitinimonas sp. BJYL2 TaxID=2976696 RepID=UPI0022B31E78|nr:cell division protein ZapA [Chitinimonas sp. BJYL2]